MTDIKKNLGDIWDETKKKAEELKDQHICWDVLFMVKEKFYTRKLAEINYENVFEYFTPQRTPVRFLKPPVHGNKTIVN
jgi:hypothetical protein